MVPVLTKNFLKKRPAAFRSFSQVGIIQEIKCNLFNCMLSPFSEWQPLNEHSTIWLERLSVCLRTKWLWVQIPLLSLAAFFVGVAVFPKNLFNLLIQNNYKLKDYSCSFLNCFKYRISSNKRPPCSFSLQASRCGA